MARSAKIVANLDSFLAKEGNVFAAERRTSTSSSSSAQEIKSQVTEPPLASNFLNRFAALRR